MSIFLLKMTLNNKCQVTFKHISGSCYICYGHFLQDGCMECTNMLAEVTTVTEGVSKKVLTLKYPI